MKLAIYGAGAIGAYLGAELALGGVEVSLIARGPHLAAMQANGVRLKLADTEKVARPFCTDDPARLGPQDFVIIALKAHSVPGVCAQLKPLLGPETAVVMAVNGVPWWYFYGLKGPHENARIRAVDPDDRQWSMIGPERAIGCVIYPAAEIVAPGVVAVQPHLSSNRLPIGEPDGTRSARTERLSKELIAAGFKAPVRTDIRTDIWVKLWGNLAFNPVSALTGSTLVDLVRDAGTHALVRTLMQEGQAVGEALGIRFPVALEARIKGAEEVGAHKTSMLQDLERGRPLEIDALVRAVAELGRLVGIATPMIDAVYTLIRRRAIEAGCYQPAG